MKGHVAEGSVIPDNPAPGLQENILQAVATDAQALSLSAMGVFRGELSWRGTEATLLVEAMKHHGFSFWQQAEGS